MFDLEFSAGVIRYLINQECYLTDNRLWQI